MSLTTVRCLFDILPAQNGEENVEVEEEEQDNQYANASIFNVLSQHIFTVTAF